MPICLLDVPSMQLLKAEQFLLPSRVSGREWFVGFNVGASSKSRTWPIEKFAHLADRILQQPDVKILLFSGPHEDEISLALYQRLKSDRVILANNLSLPELAALFTHCRILVSNDTGPMHLGVAAGVPTLGLFSVARPEHYRPLGPFSRYVRGQPIENVSVEAVHAEFQQIQECLRAQSTRQAQMNQ